MTNNIIFYHPHDIAHDSNRPSQMRPAKMLEAFIQLGFSVDVVAGGSVQRARQIEVINQKIREGKQYQFVYGESTNVPIILNDRDRIPRRIMKDYLFFKELKKQIIPFGFFYRDLYWRFDVFQKMLPLHQRLISLPFYYLDWCILNRYISYLFLPSKQMNEALPMPFSAHHVTDLPPGIDEASKHDSLQKPMPIKHRQINCLYVGGIEPPLYDLRETISTITGIENVSLTICCRYEEWLKNKKYYCLDYPRNKINFVHKSGIELAKLYKQADLFLMVRSPHLYLNFAMPYKLFEAIGYGIPIISNGENTASNFILKNNIGWVVHANIELTELFEKTLRDHCELEQKQKNVLLCQPKNTWIKRAEKVKRCLIKKV